MDHIAEVCLTEGTVAACLYRSRRYPFTCVVMLPDAGRPPLTGIGLLMAASPAATGPGHREPVPPLSFSIPGYREHGLSVTIQ